MEFIESKTDGGVDRATVSGMDVGQVDIAVILAFIDQH